MKTIIVSLREIKQKLAGIDTSGLIIADNLIELGTLIQQGGRRKDDEQTTVADLTGVAVQDIQIAIAVAHST